MSTGPTVFEVAASESLNDLIFPAFSKMTLKLTNTNYSFISLHNNRRLVYVVLVGLLQWRHFAKFGSSISEYHYGLTRVPVGKSGGKRARGLIMVLNILESTLWPVFQDYLLEKQESLNVRNNGNRRQERLKVGLDAFMFVMRIAKSFILALYLLGYLQSSNIWQAISSQKLARLSSSLNNTFSSHGIILLALTRFINTTESASSKPKSRIPPPPPEIPARVHVKKGVCPICNNSIVNPAMSFGYVLCYACVCDYVQQHKRCPVTLLTQSQEGIYKIYA